MELNRRGIAHTHSVNAVAFAQAGLDIPTLGTTHADYFYGAVPCTRELTKEEVEEAYELNTGKVIVDCIRQREINPIAVPGVVVKNHGPFSWGKDAAAAVYHAVVMDVVAEMNLKTLLQNPMQPCSSIFWISITCANMVPVRIMGRSETARLKFYIHHTLLNALIMFF